MQLIGNRNPSSKSKLLLKRYPLKPYQQSQEGQRPLSFIELNSPRTLLRGSSVVPSYTIALCTLEWKCSSDSLPSCAQWWPTMHDGCYGWDLTYSLVNSFIVCVEKLLDRKRLPWMLSTCPLCMHICALLYGVPSLHLTTRLPWYLLGRVWLYKLNHVSCTVT